MSDKIVIELDYKNMKKAQTSVENLEESVKSARKTIKNFGGQKVITEITGDNTKFIAALKKADFAAKDYQKTQSKILDSINNTTNRVIDKITAKIKTFSQGSYNASVNLIINSAVKNISTLEARLNNLSQGNWNVKVTTVSSKLEKPTAKTLDKGMRAQQDGDRVSEGKPNSVAANTSKPVDKEKPKSAPKTFKEKFLKVKDDFLKDPLGTIQSGMSKVEEKFTQAEDIFNKFSETKDHYNKIKDIIKPKRGEDSSDTESSGDRSRATPDERSAPSGDNTSRKTGIGKVFSKFDSIKNIYGSATDFIDEGKKFFSFGKKKDGSENGKSGGFLDKLENLKNMGDDAKDVISEVKNLISLGDGESSSKSWINKLTDKFSKIKDSNPLSKVKSTAGKALESVKSSNFFQKVGSLKESIKGGEVLGKIKGFAGKAIEGMKPSNLRNMGKSLISKVSKVPSLLGETAGKRALSGGLISKAGAGLSSLGGKAMTAGTQVISKLGVAGTAGAAVTVMGVADGAKDLYKGYKADNDYDKKYETTKGASKIGATLTGAAVGTAILPGVGTLFGSAIGYLFGKFGGEKLGEKVAGGAEGATKYADKSENAAIKVAEASVPEFEKYKQQAAGAQTQEQRDQLLSGFLDKMDGTTKALEALAEKNREEGKDVPEEVTDYLTKIEALKALSGGSTLPQDGQPYQANIVTDKNLIPPLGQNGFSLQEGAQSPIPTELQIDGNKVINGQSPITPEELGVPPFISTTVDVYIKENKIIGDPPKGAKGVAGTIASLGSTIIKGASKALKNLNQFRGGIVGGSFPGFAEGGYVQGGAQLITVAEEGTPEAIIPLGKHRRKRAMELFSQVGSYLQAPGFSPKGFAAGGIVGGSIGSGFGGGMPTVVEVGGVEIKVEAKDGQNLVETIRDHKEEISEEIAGVFNAAFKGQFANTPASGGVSA